MSLETKHPETKCPQVQKSLPKHIYLQKAILIRFTIILMQNVMIYEGKFTEQMIPRE
jgi:hypothetical protein